MSSNLTLKAIAYETGMADSAVFFGGLSAPIQVAAPLNPSIRAGGSIRFSAVGDHHQHDDFLGASIRYTTDGSTPSETVGTAYSGPVAGEQQPHTEGHRLRKLA